MSHFDASSANSTGSGACKCPKPRTVTSLEFWSGRLVAKFSDGSFHPITPRIRFEGAGAERIDLGCVYVTREALEAVNKVVAEHDEFQRKKSESLMKRLKGKIR